MTSEPSPFWIVTWTGGPSPQFWTFDTFGEAHRAVSQGRAKGYHVKLSAYGTGVPGGKHVSLKPCN